MEGMVEECGQLENGEVWVDQCSEFRGSECVDVSHVSFPFIYVVFNMHDNMF